jgi:hypothetical protein
MTTIKSIETTDRHYHNNRGCSECRRLHHEELYDLYSSPNSIRGIKSKRVRYGGACRTYGGEVHIEFCWGDLRETDRLQNLGVNVRIIILRQGIPVYFLSVD